MSDFTPFPATPIDVLLLQHNLHKKKKRKKNLMMICKLQRIARKHNQSDTNEGQGFCTTLFYVVEVEPKLWLPVHLVQGKLCGEIKMNLSSIQTTAERASQN